MQDFSFKQLNYLWSNECINEAKEYIDGSGFAGAVLAQQTKNFTFTYRQVKVLQSSGTLVLLTQRNGL